ncbi:MAG: hypothetical protein AABN33_00715 [Acidobacteriota bacterium]
MPRRFVLLSLASLLLCVSTAEAQGTHQFLGAPREVPDQFTVKHGIRYNTQGYDEPHAKWKKKIRAWRENDVPDSIIEELLAFPGSPDAIGQWIDDAFDQTLAQFTACGGTLTERARQVSATEVSVVIMPSAFFEPYYKILVAGVYYPTPNQIKVLNIYYIWEGEHKGWLRRARDLLAYEMANYFGVACGIQAEPRTAAWPCDAPPVITPQ